MDVQDPGDSDLIGRLLRRKRQDAKDPEAQQLFVCAPMVRYSKLGFRLLARRWGFDLAYTPMIVSDAFAASTRARDSEFTTCEGNFYRETHTRVTRNIFSALTTVKNLLVSYPIIFLF